MFHFGKPGCVRSIPQLASPPSKHKQHLSIIVMVVGDLQINFSVISYLGMYDLENNKKNTGNYEWKCVFPMNMIGNRYSYLFSWPYESAVENNNVFIYSSHYHLIFYIMYKKTAIFMVYCLCGVLGRYKKVIGRYYEYVIICFVNTSLEEPLMKCSRCCG